jgi:hypothetical protein
VKRPTPAAASTTGGGTRRKLFGTVCAGLLAGLLYLSAAASASAATCPNEAVRIQQAAQGLADCRAYEMVSPVDKSNGDVSPNATSRSSLDGNAFEYETLGAFGGAEGAAHSNQYVATRTPTGWASEALNPYQTPNSLAPVFPDEGSFELTSDLSKYVLYTNHDPNDRSGDNSADQIGIYLRIKGVPGFMKISPASLAPGLFWTGPLYVGASSDMSRIFFESTEALTDDAPPFTTEAYEWHNGEVSVIGRLPNDEIDPGGARVGQGSNPESGGAPETQPAISGDGSQVVLTIGSPHQLYLREAGHSKLISFSQASGEEGAPAAHGATFLGSASSNGRRLTTIYFASPDLLTDNAEGDPEEPGADELYAYDVTSEQLTLISVDTEPAENPANPVSMPGARVYTQWISNSADGRYVYFFADSNLTPDGNQSTEKMYVWHDGEITYMADRPTTLPNTNGQARNMTRLSADGTRLVFLSDGIDPAVPTPQVYLYDAPSNHWTCVSCNPYGPTRGEARFKTYQQFFGGLEAQLYIPNNLSTDGSRVFFETKEALVPQDGNGAPDVYEWHEGQLNLISSGRGLGGADFLGASPNGHDVFIATREQLVGEDKDSLLDAYDAREGGGYLSAGFPDQCEGDSCQLAPGSVAPWSAPASTAVVAGGSARAHRKICPRKRRIVRRRNRHRRVRAARYAGAARVKGGKAGTRARCGSVHKASKKRGRR